MMVKGMSVGSSVIGGGSGFGGSKMSSQGDPKTVYQVSPDGSITVETFNLGLRFGDIMTLKMPDGSEIPVKVAVFPKRKVSLNLPVGTTVNLKPISKGVFEVQVGGQKIVQQKIVEVPQTTPSDVIPSPTKTGEKIAKETKKVDLSEVEFVDILRAKDIPPTVRDFYMYDSELEERNKPTVLLLGAPGVGKSVGVREATQELAKSMGRTFYDYSDSLGIELLQNEQKRKNAFVFVDLRLTEMEPQDLAGFPEKAGVNGGKYMTYLPPLWAQTLAMVPGILFLDELTNVNRVDVLAASYKIMLDKKVGFLSFHPEVMVIAAGNPPEVSAIARELPAPLINRTTVMHSSVPEVPEWVEWMDKKYGEAWDKRIAAFLMNDSFKHLILKPPKQGETLENFPSPRAWTKVAVMLPQIDPRNAKMLIEGTVGREAANQFIPFVRLKPPEIDDLLKNKAMWQKLNVDIKWLTIVGISSAYAEAVKKKNYNRLMDLLSLVDMIGDDKREYVSAIPVMAGMNNVNDSIMLIAEKGGADALKIVEKSFKGYIEALKIIGEMKKK